MILAWKASMRGAESPPLESPSKPLLGEAIEVISPKPASWLKEPPPLQTPLPVLEVKDGAKQAGALMLGLEKLGWLKTLYPWKSNLMLTRSVSWKLLETSKLVHWKPGPRQKVLLLPENWQSAANSDSLPVAGLKHWWLVLSQIGAKAAGLNHW